MQSFSWNDNYVTGLSEVDEQHHYLVDLINAFGDKVVEDVLVYDDLKSIINELIEYTDYHFTEEEELMSKSNIDERHLNIHVEAHKDFIQEIKNMSENISVDTHESMQHLLDFLIHWLAYHILYEDQNMARQIKAISSGLTPAEAYDTEEHGKHNATEPLILALNGLFNLLSSRNKQLVQLNKSLEEKVQERTKALSKANHHLEELALTDTLTGLPNRLHALRSMAILWKESIKTASTLSCMMIDADYFKEVNDTYGHDAGDMVLRSLAKTLQDSIRNDDIICRLGGDEFLIICPNTDINGAQRVAQNICEAVSEISIKTDAFIWDGSVSIGVAQRSDKMKNYDELIKAADQGVYAAKKRWKRLCTNNYK